MTLEICANGLESALIAEQGGAQRIELCVNLEVGGLTPSFDVIKTTVQKTSLPVYVLIRPCPGDFCYNQEELSLILSDIELCKKVGVSGIVFGALNQEKRIDWKTMNQVMRACDEMDFTFHRAFDEVAEPKKALQELIKHKIPRLLTSGQEKSAEQGLPLLEQLLQQANGTIEIMPGSGIGSQNVALFKKAGFQSIHLSATKGKPSQPSDLEEIQKVVKIIKG